MFCQIIKKVSESKWKNRQTELSSKKKKNERNRMIEKGYKQICKRER